MHTAAVFTLCLFVFPTYSIQQNITGIVVMVSYYGKINSEAPWHMAPFIS